MTQTLSSCHQPAQSLSSSAAQSDQQLMRDSQTLPPQGTLSASSLASLVLASPSSSLLISSRVCYLLFCTSSCCCCCSCVCPRSPLALVLPHLLSLHLSSDKSCCRQVVQSGLTSLVIEAAAVRSSGLAPVGISLSPLWFTSYEHTMLVVCQLPHKDLVQLAFQGCMYPWRRHALNKWMDG